ATRPSYDMETEIDQVFETDHISEEMIHKATNAVIGEIQQYPPMFSAIKKDGKRLYELAREGKSVDIQPRTIYIHSFEITKIDMPKLYFRVKCSKGTYIRSLAYDFGKFLNSGAYLSSLRRTKIGDFNVDNAIDPNTFNSLLEP